MIGAASTGEVDPARSTAANTIAVNEYAEKREPLPEVAIVDINTDDANWNKGEYEEASSSLMREGI